jgi:N-acetylglucosamine transport system permease protein
MRHGKYPFIIGFLVVPVALYAVFVVWAYIQAFYLSVYEWSGLGPVEHFVGQEQPG